MLPDVLEQSLQLGVGDSLIADDLAHQGVLAENHHSLATQSHTNLGHLQRADVVDADDEDVLVVAKDLLELVFVAGLAGATLHTSGNFSHLEE